MLRRTGLQRVVFTEGFPFLEVFASRHFLPEHPLRHSNLWLDERDFETVQRSAKIRGLASPLQIDPYAHHPKLSPYAAAAKRNSSASSIAKKKSKPKHSATSADTRRKGDPSSRTAPNSSTTDDAAYRVPVCATTVYRHLHLFNADQMMLLDHRVLQSVPMDAPQNMYASQYRTAFGENPGDRVQDGVRALRAHLTAFPVADTQHYNAETKKAYYFGVTPALEQLRLRRGFSHRWWGTVKQWARIGAVPQPCELDNTVALPVRSKLVHLSLIANAEAVLSSSIIFSKTGVLLYLFPDALAETGPHGAALHLHEGGLDGLDAGDIMSFPHASAPRTTATMGTQNDVFRRLLAATRTHGYAVPLYASSSQVARAGWVLREGAVGVPSSSPLGLAASEPLLDAIPEAVEVVSGHDVPPPLAGTPRSASVPSKTMSLNDARFFVPEDPEHDQTSCTPPARTCTVFFYHISQVHLPDPFVFPSTVITAELEHPLGTPLHGVTGTPLPFDALRPDQLALSQPQLAALVSAVPAGLVHAAPTIVAAVEAALRGPQGCFAPLSPPAATLSARQQQDARTTAQRAARAELESLLEAAQPQILEEANGNMQQPTGTVSEMPPEHGETHVSVADSGVSTPHAEMSDSAVSPSSSSSQKATADAPKRLKDIVTSEQTLSQFVEAHASAKCVQGRPLWFLAKDILDQNGIVDVNATPIEVVVEGEEVVPGYRLGPRGLEPLSETSPSWLIDGAGRVITPKRFFNAFELEEPAAMFRSVNTTHVR